ncbi:MAG TPA: TetR family transcriptional regulator [Pseudonocardiaceae bacterium]|nr:TetR family transcriptional regulator [Pseudonocardiaceae bacterium]
MGRTKDFDPDTTLVAAMELFWRKGYEATSVQDLVDHLGVARASLYHTFGSKHDLYLRALDHYTAQGADGTLTWLAEPGPVLPALRAGFRALAQDYARATERNGCLVTNTTVELVPADESCTQRVTVAYDQMERDLTIALLRAGAQGELAPNADPRALARFLVTFLQGVKVLAKLPDRTRLVDAIEQALRLLD